MTPDMQRVDGTQKSETGFLGPIPNTVTGKTMTEVSMGIEIDGEDYIECMNRAELYSYPYYTNCSNRHAVSELYPLNSSCREWLKV